MRSPRDMQIIQIELTNACVHECSNCTRFCGHHKKNFFMDWDTYKRAVDSLKDFKGTIGIMGGEPTLHPEFDRFVHYLHDQIKYKKTKNNFIKPSEDFIKKIHQQEIENRKIHKNVYGKDKNAVYGAGLWSALVPTYYQHFELIQDVFRIQVLNDHSHVMYHSPILFSRKDMGIDDAAWTEIRDNCWAQQNWSASITPKGAFFCEIAAAMDILFDGPGGIPIEPGWWKKEPEEFKQYNWCEFCGIALAPFTRDANDEIDDISESIYNKLKNLESPKIKKGKYHIIKFDKKGKAIKDDSALKEILEAKYWDDFSDRFDEANNVIRPKGIDGIILYKNGSLDNLIQNSEQLNKIIIAAEENIVSKILELKDKFKCELCVFSIKSMKYGEIINKALSFASIQDFVLLLDEKIILDENFKSNILSLVLNPGTMHWHKVYREQNRFIKNSMEIENADIALFSRNASSFKNIGFDRIANSSSLGDILALWDENKIIDLVDANFIDNNLILETGKRYVIYGTGATAEAVTKQIEALDAEIVCYCNSDTNTWGKEFKGRKIVGARDLADLKKQGAQIIVASNYYTEIKLKLEENGISIEDCIVFAL